MDLLFDHGFIGKEELHYDACIRVPLLVVGPGIKEAVEREEFVQLEDIAPTILEAAGLEMPPLPVMGPFLPEAERDHRGLPAAHCSGWPAATGIAGTERRPTSRATTSHIPETPGHWARTLRTERYRYTFYPRGYGEQLFDLVSDPGETVNLARDAGLRQVRSEIRERLLEQIVLQDYPKTRRGLFALGVS